MINLTLSESERGRHHGTAVGRDRRRDGIIFYQRLALLYHDAPCARSHHGIYQIIEIESRRRTDTDIPRCGKMVGLRGIAVYQPGIVCAHYLPAVVRPLVLRKHDASGQQGRAAQKQSALQVRAFIKLSPARDDGRPPQSATLATCRVVHLQRC